VAAPVPPLGVATLASTLGLLALGLPALGLPAVGVPPVGVPVPKNRSQ
jgi:hypothetical protein